MTTENHVNQHAVDLIIDNKHLAEQHGLIKTIAYIRSRPTKEQSAGAARVAKLRAKKKALGLVQVDVPAEVAEAIKSAGSINAWIIQNQLLYPPTKMNELLRLAEIGRKVERFPTWIRWLIKL